LPDVADAFEAIAGAGKPAAKQQITLGLLQRATPLEAKYLIKIILGDMRTGIKVSLVEEAIAAAYGRDRRRGSERQDAERESPGGAGVGG
jgi:DNA ligase-1